MRLPGELVGGRGPREDEALERLTTIDGWQDMPLTKAAQKVQVSAYPQAYAKHENQAGDIIQAIHGEGPYADIAQNLS